MSHEAVTPVSRRRENIRRLKMLGVCVQATNHQGFIIKGEKNKATAWRYADDRACSQGQVAEKEKVGVEEEEVSQRTKQPSETCFSESRTKMRPQTERCKTD